MTITQVISHYEKIIQGIVSLFAPLVECAIHDIKSGTIVAIYNPISNRKIGDKSPLATLEISVSKFPDVFEPYYETNWNGHKIKCTTITIRDEKRNPCALICFNFDTHFFQDIQLNLKAFLDVKKNADNPVELYSQNSEQHIDLLIENYLSTHNVFLSNLTREQKQSLIQNLSKNGVFFLKKAPQYVAAKLNISRATIYNHLKVLRAQK